MSLRGAYAESTFPYFFESPKNRGRLTQIAYAVHAKHSNLCFFPRGCHGPPRPYNIYIYMKPARGPKTIFFNNYCNGIPGLANYEMPNEPCEGNFLGTSFRHRDSRSARNGCHGAAYPRLRYLTDHQQSWNTGYGQLS